MIKAGKIVIPSKPHLDPVAAIWILRRYGEEMFAGIKEAPLQFVEANVGYSEAERQELENQGTIMIDVGGGRFDHHNDQNKLEETSTSLVAEFLGVADKAELSALLSYIREDDLQGLHNRFGDLAQLLKVMYKQGIDQNEVIELAMRIIDLFQAGQQQWHFEVKEEYEKKCHLLRARYHKKNIKVGVILSDNMQLGNYGLNVDNLSVVINRRSTGHVAILTNKKHKIDLRQIIAVIRNREMESRGAKKEADLSRLAFEGSNSQVPNWFYHRSLNAFLNGSDALAKVEPTVIPFKELVYLTLCGLAEQRLDLSIVDFLDAGAEAKADKMPPRGYFAAVLTADSSEALKCLAVHPDVYAHHLTLAYLPDATTYAKYAPRLGEQINIKVIGLADDGKAQAAVVEAESENDNPHITISCEPGVKPVYSNEMLKKTPVKSAKMDLVAKIEFIQF